MKTPKPAHQGQSNQVAEDRHDRRPSARIARLLSLLVDLARRSARATGYVLILHPLALLVWLVIALVILWALRSMSAADYRPNGLSVLCIGALAVTVLTLIMYFAFTTRCLIVSTARAWRGDARSDVAGLGSPHTQQGLRIAVVGRNGVVAEMAETLADAGHSVSVFPARTVRGGTLHYEDPDRTASTRSFDPNRQVPAHMRILTYRVFSEELSISDLLRLGRFDALVVTPNCEAGRSTQPKAGP
jgi:hypothetical protein